MEKIIIRPEQPADNTAVRLVNETAFGRPDEANMVDSLRGRGKDILSLVAEVDGQVVGHVFFSPVVLHDPAGSKYPGVGLGPVAVLPAYQNQGIGGGLIRQGLEQLRSAGYPYCVVLGHTKYYPRFGFTPGFEWGIKLAIPVPPEAFMVMELQAGALGNRTGTITYEPELMG